MATKPAHCNEDPVQSKKVELNKKTNCDRCFEIEVKNIHRTIDGKYQSCIANWGKSMYAHHLEYGFAYDHLGISLIVSTIAVLYDPHYIILLIFHTKSFLSDRTIIPCSK